MMDHTGRIRKNMIWNVAGSMCFVGAQWAMTILIVHLSGYESAGWLSLGLSLTNVATNIIYFGIRNYQVSDSDSRYSDDIYIKQRIFTAITALAVYMVFVAANGYVMKMGIFLVLFMMYRASEPLADVFHGIDQKSWRLDIAGRSFIMRGLLGLAAFCVMQALFNELVLTTCVMILAVYPVIFLYDIPNSAKIAGIDSISIKRGDGRKILSLSKECLPLFLYALCLNSVVPIPRYFLERTSGSAVLGYYSSVAIPASIIQLFSSYVFTTFTGLFSEYASTGDTKAFRRLTVILCAAIAAIAALAGVACMIPLPGVVSGVTAGARSVISAPDMTLTARVGSSIRLGEWALCLLFNEGIREYTYLLVPTIGVCGIIALVWFLGMLLTVLRDRAGLLAGAAAGVLLCLVISPVLVERMGADGVNPAVGISSGLTLVFFMYRLRNLLVKLDKKQEPYL